LNDYFFGVQRRRQRVADPLLKKEKQLGSAAIRAFKQHSGNETAAAIKAWAKAVAVRRSATINVE